MNIFLYTNKSYNTSLIKMTQRTNNKHNSKILTYILYELQYMLDDDKKIFMAITLNFYIVVNKIYLYNYSEKITIWLMG